ncbi:MAG: Flp family type IVb pilin [Aestuariivirga sp.]
MRPSTRNEICRRGLHVRCHVVKAVRGFLGDETGATAIEYGLIVALVSVGLVVVLQEVGTGLRDTFQKIADTLTPS